MTATYKCQCKTEIESTQEEETRRRHEFFAVFRSTHPDKTHDNEEQFRKAMRDFKAAKLTTTRYVKCKECEVRRQMNEMFLGMM